MRTMPVPTPEPLVDVERARRLMLAEGLDAIAAHSFQHLFYLSGLHALDLVVEMNAVNFAVLPASSREEAQVTIPSFGRYMLDDFPLWPPGKVVYGTFHITGGPPAASVAADAIGALRVALGNAGADRGRVGFELDLLPIRVARRIAEELPGIELVDCAALLRELRLRKTRVELERIRTAGAALDAALQETFAQVRVGMTELELDRILRRALLDRDVEPVSVSLGAGERGALVWSYPTDRRVAAGEVIRFDITCERGLYHADLARTVAVGEASEAQRRRYAAVVGSCEAGIAALRAGATCGEVFAAAVDVPRAAGYPEFDRHNFGHGIGLEVHEGPALAQTGEVVPAGAAMCVEAPFYVYGEGGFTAEDMLVVHADRVERLTHVPAELPVLG